MPKKTDGAPREKVTVGEKSIRIVGIGGHVSFIDRKPDETLGDTLARHREENLD